MTWGFDETAEEKSRQYVKTFKKTLDESREGEGKQDEARQDRIDLFQARLDSFPEPV